MRNSAVLSLAAAVLMTTAAGAYAQATGEQDRMYVFPGMAISRSAAPFDVAIFDVFDAHKTKAK
jgi:hypothetical protein